MTVLGKLADQRHRLLDATHISATEHLQIVHECYIEELLIIKTLGFARTRSGFQIHSPLII